MNEEQIRTFLAVAQEGSFSKAQEKQYISKQAMFKQINKLEEEIGCTLFVRGKSGVTLTPSGEIFREGVTKLCRQLDKLMLRCREAAGQENTLRIGNVEHQVLLSPVTQMFAQRYPQIRLSHVVHPNHSGEWRVENGIQDVAETFYNEQTDRSDYTFLPLTMKSYVLAMRKGHPLEKMARLMEKGSDTPRTGEPRDVPASATGPKPATELMTGLNAGPVSATGPKPVCVSLEQASHYDLYFFPMMVGPEFSRQIREIFEKEGNLPHLFPRGDVDNQVAVAYECLDSDRILLTANPFITGIPQLDTVRLSPERQRQYGIIFKEPMTDAVQKYVALAREYYGRQFES